MPKEYYLPTRRLVQQDEAAITERANVPRSKFIGAWTRKMAFDAGLLVPFLVDEILPGDHMTYNVTAYVRLQTPLFPILDNQRIDTFFFYCPCRLVWENWVRFMGEQTPNADSSINYTVPQVLSPPGGFGEGQLYDHFGLATDLAGADQVTVNNLPARAYNLIWNLWFRDQNVTDGAVVDLDNGPDTEGDYRLKRRMKAHDYFTSALPWPQKFLAPTIALGGLAPVLGLGTTDTNATTGPIFPVDSVGTPTFEYYHTLNTANNFMEMTAAAGGRPMVFADLSAVSGVAINTFRQAFLVQQLLERDARGGTRYTELIRNHFGVTNPDFRLQRPEYIGGGQSPLIITPVAQTAPSAEGSVGALGAAGTASGQHRASYAATEHGYIIGMINVRTELSYQQGIHRMWDRRTRYDFYWPSLAGLGEQAITRREIYAKGVGDDNTVFGYQERWHEYRTRYSEVTGIMRSTATGTLDAWHLAQHFLTGPTLSTTFLQEDPPMTRVLAGGETTVGQQYLADIMINRTAVRPIPTFGTPAILGRF